MSSSGNRPTSVRLRSALGKADVENPVFNSNANLTSDKSSRSSRRTNGNHGNLVNGNHGSSTRSQSRTRGLSFCSSGSALSAMDIDDSSIVSSVPPPPIIDPPETPINVNNSCDNKNGKDETASTGSNNANTSPPRTTEVEAKVEEENSMEVDDSSSDSRSSEDSSDSSDSDSDELNEQTSETRKLEYQTNMENLEKQFAYLRELLYQERMSQICSKLEEVRSGKAKEYIGPLSELQEQMRIRISTTASLRQFRLVNVQHKFEAEELAIRQNYESEKQLLYDSIKSDLEEKIRRLEEDRNNDFTSELWLETVLKRKNKKSMDLFGDKKNKKPVAVSGPYLVYLLNDVDIVEDWTTIKKALAAPKRKPVEMVY